MSLDHGFILLLIAACGAFFMAFCNGANDVANAFASAVGSKALKPRMALLIASVVTFCGAVFLGGEVVVYLIEGLAPPKIFASPHDYVLGMIAVLLSAGLFVLLSTLKGMPVSATHAIVGGLTGVAVTLQGWEAINWFVMFTIASTWVVAPVLAAICALLLASFIRRVIIGQGTTGTLKRVRRRLPALISFTISAAAFGIMVSTRLGEIIGAGIWESALLAVFLFLPVYAQSKYFVKRTLKKAPDNPKGAERAFRRLQVGTSCYVAFGNGSNDVSNSISPVFAIYMVYQSGGFPQDFTEESIPFWILALGGLGIATGITFLGKRVIKTLGKKITKINHSRGFSIDFSVASIVVGASLFGLPVSTTQAATGAVVGAGLSRGALSKVNFRMIGYIILTWIITVPTAGLITIAVYHLLSLILPGTIA
tara:strand:- start:89665 stop:90936 length:1272 start_codon:yes stop_codon:yes gene_type:complete